MFKKFKEWFRSLFRRKITVEVTEDDIRQGLRLLPNRCPIARAAQRSFHKQVSVQPHDIIVYDPNEKVYPVPESVIKFIRDFDDGEPVQPFTFQI